MCTFSPRLHLDWNPHCSQVVLSLMKSSHTRGTFSESLRTLLVDDSTRTTLDVSLETLLWEFSTGDSPGTSIIIGLGVSGGVTGAVDSGAEVFACDAWCRAARSRFFSRSTGPRCRGRDEGEGVGEGGGKKAGMEWEAPGCPRVQLKPTVARPSLVVRLRVALPPRAQTERNSVTDAVTNCEFDFEDIVECERVNHW